MANKNNKKSKSNQKPAQRKTREDHRRRKLQVVFALVSIVIVLAMVLSMLQFA
ncbi:MAG: hypothetical protein JW750_10860 [Anaerolineaceae bacterium]|nr:hypothetical protein [Anaerolineaceae bacterium]